MKHKEPWWVCNKCGALIARVAKAKGRLHELWTLHNEEVHNEERSHAATQGDRFSAGMMIVQLEQGTQSLASDVSRK